MRSGHCQASEEVVFTCRGGGGVTSVCLGTGTVSIRRTMRGKPPAVVSSDARWSNVRMFVNRSQGGLNQDRIRISDGARHTIVYWGETGSLAERPGRRFDGVKVLVGPKGEQSAESFECTRDRSREWQPVDSIQAQAPAGWNGEEAPDGPFDGIF
jgi:hypothetical protein